MLQRLAADASVAAIVGQRIYAQEAGRPDWPFIKTGPATTQPRKATGTDGGQIALDLHGFARADEVDGTVIETGEDYASRLGEAVEGALDDAWVDLEDGSRARISLSDMRLLQDDEPGAFHYFAQVNARVLVPTGV